ncbi:MAG: endo-1,4-beta-xylanase [Oscillospiraceae bacterium]|nr:endo-1,4-beta-xylanase [Oscillospiraceae bacterium]
MSKSKKKLISMLTVMAMLICVFQFAVPVLATETAIRNDFEVNYDGWTSESEHTEITAIPEAGVGGSRGMKFSGRLDSSDSIHSQKGFYIWDNTDYTYSIFVRHDEPQSETFTLTLRWLFYDEEVYDSSVIAVKNVKPGVWTEIKGKYAIPKGSENATVFLATDSAADFYFDDFSATRTYLKSPFESASAIPATTGLKDVYANHFRVGNILNGTTVRNSALQALVLLDYNSITAENEMKPDSTMTQSGSTNTNITAQLNSNATAIIDFCVQNNIPMRGHVLTWHGQTPDWFFLSNVQDANWRNYRNGAMSSVPWATAAVMNQRLESYIQNLFNLYKTRYPSLNLYAYDVVNEAVAGEGGMRPAGFDFNGAGGIDGASAGDSPWQAVYGANSTVWIKNAFTYARKYAPSHTKLFYNDFNEWHAPKRDWIINNILKPLKADGVLDGMGMQGHVSADPGTYAWSRWSLFRDAMDAYAAAGVEVQITEMEVTAGSTESPTQWLDLQPARYKQTFEHAITVNSRNGGKITAICIWGINDANTWISGNREPTLHGRQNQRKAAYDAVADVVPQSQWGDGKNPSFGGGNIPVEPVKPDANGWYFHDTFENSTDNWEPRGGTTLETSGRTFAAGAESLAVRNRTATWHGALKNLNPLAFEAGKEYSFSVCTVYLDGGENSEEIALTLEHTVGGETSWINIARATPSRGQWVQLANKNFLIPAGATNLRLVVESPTNAEITFYMDEAIGAVAGTTINPPSGLGNTTTTTSVSTATTPTGTVTTPNQSDMAALFAGITPTASLKAALNNNPLITQRFTADPGYLVYKDRMYVYTTNDVVEYDSSGKVIDNTYGKVNTINCISSSDLVNWTDHGAIPAATSSGAATFASQSWAPTAAWKTINGQDKFFLYFCNNASGIVVLTADSPTGPWTSPRNSMLVTRSTPGCADVVWCFDPHVFVDDDGTGYLYFGGGIPGGDSPTAAQYANPKTARVIKLGDDMVSVSGSAVMIDAPYMFEDSGMNKIGDTYYYTYCSNFNTGNFAQTGFRGGVIQYMTGDSPMGPFTHKGEVFRSPNEFFPNNGGNNHHSIVEFKGKNYFLYHTRQLQNAMGITGNYRSTQIDSLTVAANGNITPVTATMTGVAQLETLNPYQTVRAATIARQAGISVRGLGNNTIVTDISKGDWVSVKGAAFTNGATSVTVRASAANGGVIKIATGSPTGTAVGYAQVPAGNGMRDITVPVSGLTGTQDVYFIFSDGGMEFESWVFASTPISSSTTPVSTAIPQSTTTSTSASVSTSISTTSPTGTDTSPTGTDTTQSTETTTFPTGTTTSSTETTTIPTGTTTSPTGTTTSATGTTTTPTGTTTSATGTTTSATGTTTTPTGTTTTSTGATTTQSAEGTTITTPIVTTVSGGGTSGESSTSVTTKPLVKRLVGDVDENGVVTINDALEILKFLAKLDSEVMSSDISLKNSLVLGMSEMPTINDALEVLKFLAKLDSKAGSWVED